MKIPIYRAKKLDSAKYVEGYLLPSLISNAMHRILVDNGSIYFVDDLTLAIHFPDMLVSQGNKIFASLSNDGKGGDICDFPNRSPLTAMRNTMDNDFDFGNVRCFKNYHMDCKVIGIQE